MYLLAERQKRNCCRKGSMERGKVSETSQQSGLRMNVSQRELISTRSCFVS